MQCMIGSFHNGVNATPWMLCLAVTAFYECVAWLSLIAQMNVSHGCHCWLRCSYTRPFKKTKLLSLCLTSGLWASDMGCFPLLHPKNFYPRHPAVMLSSHSAISALRFAISGCELLHEQNLTDGDVLRGRDAKTRPLKRALELQFLAC